MKEIPFEQPSFEESVEKAVRVSPDEVSLNAPLVRTFKTDVATLLEKTKTTKLDVVIAEKARARERQKGALVEEGDSHLGKTIFILLLLFAFGIGVGAYALIGARISVPFLSPPKPLAEESSQPKEVQNSGVVIITDSPREQILVDLAALFRGTTLAPGGVRIVKFVTVDAQSKVQQEATARLLLTAFAGSGPSEDFLHSIDTTAAYGILSSENLSGFLRLRSRAYAETFAGMLSWEPKMAEGLIPFLRPDVKRSDIALLRGRSWKDEPILGTNARVLSDPDGVSLLAYAFPDKKMLIIAGGRDALQKLIALFQAETK